jgi:hypothetical protein
MNTSNLQQAEPRSRAADPDVRWLGQPVAFWAAAFWPRCASFSHVLYEPSPMFQAGKPADYQVREVSTRFKEAQRVG